MSENGEIYTAGKNFTLPPGLTGWTNSTSEKIFACQFEHKISFEVVAHLRDARWSSRLRKTSGTEASKHNTSTCVGKYLGYKFGDKSSNPTNCLLDAANRSKPGQDIFCFVVCFLHPIILY